MKVYELGWLETGPAAIAMERLHGETLADHLKREKRMTPRDALELGAQICDALMEVHTHAIVHRDLKPANVFLVGQRGALVPKLLDFGIGRDLNDGDRLTGSGVLLGTPAFLAPEQVAQKTVVDERADLYTVGVLMYLCLTGRLPFEGNPVRVLMMVVRDQPKRASEVEPALGAAFDGLLATCLAKTPSDRFQSAEEMRDALRASIPRT